MSFDFDARNGNETIEIVQFHKFTHHVHVALLEASILSVLPTAVNDTREGEGVTRELATGSTTSSRVMEFISNQASEIFQATDIKNQIPSHVAVHAVVNSFVNNVQSTVPDNVFVPFATHAVHVAQISVNEIDVEVAATLVVLQKHLNLYLVLGLQGIK